MWIRILLLALLATSAEAARERKLYVGSNSTEAMLEFNHRVMANTRTAPSLEAAEEQIEEQVVHMFGPMGEARYKAVPKGEHKISKIKVAKVAGGFEISYAYKGVIVLENGPTTEYQFVLPVNPDTIYEAGFTGRTNPCTDHHYQSEGDFWYFWNPANYGCRLKEGEHYDVVKGKITRFKNTETTYPEYSRLADDKGEIKISLLMGMDETTKGRDPNTSTDENAKNFRDIKKSLIQRGYKNSLMPREEVAKISGRVRTAPYVENFVKIVKRNGKPYQILVQVFFGPSGIDEDSTAFHGFFRDALKNSSIMMYDGHSGLGGHLDLGSLEESYGVKFQPNKSRYQIYFFNSCTSYTYYNTMYFGRKKSATDKKGTKNLDIMTNGLATYFSVMHDTNLAVVKAVEAWASGQASVSYQAIAKAIDSDNLFGVNGDEDNPTTVE